ncbi:unnamed protein product [Prunus armeniaca]
MALQLTGVEQHLSHKLMEMDHVGWPLDWHVGFSMGTPCKPCKRKKIFLSFDVGLWASIVRLPRVKGGEVALMLRSVGLIPKVGAEGTPGPGVPQVPLRESSEGDLKLSSGGITALSFGNPTWGRGQTLFLPASSVQRLTLAKSEGRVEPTGEGTSERFDFRASRVVCSPQDERHVAKVMMARGALMRRLVFRGVPLPNTLPINRDDPGGEFTLHLVRSESSV